MSLRWLDFGLMARDGKSLAVLIVVIFYMIYLFQ